MARKTNFVQSLFLLLAVVGVGFAVFENRKALASKLSPTPRSQENLTPKQTSETETIKEPSQKNKSPSQEKTTIVIPPTQQIPTPNRNEESAPTVVRTVKSEPSRTVTRIQKPQVLRPSFLTPTERLNPKEFNKRKFGIDNAKLRSALKKSASARSIDERKQIEAERARAVFDSRSISNF